MVDMRKKSDQKRRLGNGERSLKKMLDILDAFAPKEVGTIKPHTGEWEIARDHEELDDKNKLRHATEPG